MIRFYETSRGGNPGWGVGQWWGGVVRGWVGRDCRIADTGAEGDGHTAGLGIVHLWQ